MPPPTWTEITDPLHNRLASVLVALLPVLFIFWALVIRRIKGYLASLLAIVIALVIAILIYRMPVSLALLSTANGAIYGLFPICWIVFPAVFLFNLTVRSGQFAIIRQFLASISADRRIQALLIAFSFGSFLEGTAGFGAPVAITAAMLTGLGFDPLYAAGICLIANTAPVAFGSIGIPIAVTSQVTGLPEQAISELVGRTLPFLSAILPFYLVTLMTGYRKAKEILPAALVSGLSFAVIQALTSNLLGPTLPDILAGIGSIICLLLLLKFWRPRSIWRFPHEPNEPGITSPAYNGRKLLWALSPFIALTVFIVVWGLPPVKDWLNANGSLSFEFPFLHNAIIDPNGHPIPHIYRLSYLSAAGTAIFLAAIISLTLSGLRPIEGWLVFRQTLRQLRFPILNITAVLAFAYLVNDAGIMLTIARALAGSGVLFPFFAPLLGWLGVFITGSDTSANALFGKLQASTATSIGVDPIVTVSANVSGGVVGKMISPTSIAIAAAAASHQPSTQPSPTIQPSPSTQPSAAGGLVGRESELFRFTVRHSFILLSIICLLVLAQAYWIKWIIPVYSIPHH
ncbi:MAG TPA: lactate permease LctP family transporter [Puia sp.]|jgi:lactate permease|nr:lactate permease LctP family transporter [Puia sp.]